MAEAVGRGAPWTVRLLDSFAVATSAGEPVDLPGGVRCLVALLACVGHPQTRSQVAARLWPELGEDRRAANLRTALWRARNLDGPPLVVPDGSTLSLHADVDVDLPRTVALARELAAGRRPQAPVPVLVELSQELLPGWTPEWVQLERERHRHLRLHALERLATTFTANGEHALAVEAAHLAVTADPLRETARLALIRALLSEGNLADANRQFHEYRELVARELGLSPSPAMTALLFPGPRP